MKPIAYSIVIATLGRSGAIERTLGTIAAQSHAPERVVVVDASGSDSLKECVLKVAKTSGLQIEYQSNQQAAEPSAANQRNQGASSVSTPLVAFIDDDMDLFPATCERICKVFQEDAQGKIGGIAARMEGASHPPPKGILWLYYRLQAGFYHETYGARLFGPAINCFPCFEKSPEELVRADWLNSACVFFRNPLFTRERFPDFPGSSFMEDVYLSASIARTHELYFHVNAMCVHRDGAGTAVARPDERRRAAMRIESQRKVAIDLLGTPHLAAKLLLHKLFITVSILRFQKAGKWQSILGTWFE